MPIALTADVHLKPTYEAAPERYDALLDILKQLDEQGIQDLILAGDTYDQTVNNPALLDELLKAYPAIQVFMIPGNHDPGLKPEAFTAPNLTVVTEPTWHPLGDQRIPFLFIPYQGGKAMGSALASAKANIGLPAQGNPWYMVGHGDYLTSRKPQNPYEPGIYMPLTSHDLGQHQPSRALLGHIHVRQTYQQVHYPGSPCGLDITETGRRYFTLLYPESNTLTAQPVNTTVIYLNETLITLPLPHEETYIRGQMAKLKDKWSLKPDEWSRVILRLQLRGYTRNLQQLQAIVHEELNGIHWETGSPDFTQVATQADPQKTDLIQQMQEKVDKEQYTLEQLGLTPDDVLEKAVQQILNP